MLNSIALLIRRIPRCSQWSTLQRDCASLLLSGGQQARQSSMVLELHSLHREDRGHLLICYQLTHLVVIRCSFEATGCIQYPWQDMDVACGVQEDIGPSKHPVHRSVNVRLVL